MESTANLIVANNIIAFKLFSNLINSNDSNVFFSPASISIALAAVYLGSDSTTKREIAKALNYENLSEDYVHSSFKEILEKFQKEEQKTVQIANCVLTQIGYPILDTFKENMVKQYNSKIEEVDFLTNSPTVTQEVNEWVKSKTNQKIPKLLETDLDPSTCVFILNAVYFKGMWEHQFDPQGTRPQEFYNNGITPTMVPTMFISKRFPVAFDEESNSQALELSYKDSNISILFILPNERAGLPELEKQLDSVLVQRIISKLHTTKVDVHLPKFKVEFGGSVSKNIKDLGISELFARGQADLTRISPTNELYVSDIIHKAVIEIDEEGTVAAAATGISICMMSMPFSFQIDHPFILVIRDKKENSILFLGKICSL